MLNALRPVTGVVVHAASAATNIDESARFAAHR
jgi:hypothetical protein